MNRFDRTDLLLGESASKTLSACRVAVFGAGGVGGYCIEALARSGVGHLDITDMDTVDLTNINRQIIALEDTVGRYKTDVIRERILAINPSAEVVTHTQFFSSDVADGYDFASYDYIVDAIDTVAGKIELVRRATVAGTPIISAMGAGNKIDPCRFEVSDIYKTSVCPLARVMRKLCRENGIPALKVVYSREEPRLSSTSPAATGKIAPGSCAFVPSVAGLIIAGEVIKDLLKIAQ